MIRVSTVGQRSQNLCSQQAFSRAKEILSVGVPIVMHWQGDGRLTVSTVDTQWEMQTEAAIAKGLALADAGIVYEMKYIGKSLAQIIGEKSEVIEHLNTECSRLVADLEKAEKRWQRRKLAKKTRRGGAR